MNHYIYTKKESNLPICNICHHEFKQIYDSSNDIDMKGVQSKVNKQIILDSLIKSLKENIDELQQENDMLNKSLQFYRDLSRNSIQQRF